jgi:3'-5' exoribonuclease 1
MLMSCQSQVDTAPLFPEALAKLEASLIKNRLIDAKTGQRLVRFCWCSDGPFDIRDFVVKQCFISQVGVSLLICRQNLVNTSRSDRNASLG